MRAREKPPPRVEMLPSSRAAAGLLSPLSVLVLLVGDVVGQSSLQLRIGVVEEPERVQLLAGSAQAALGEEGEVKVTSVEPDEPLSLPLQVCAQAAEGAVCALCAGAGVSLGSAAAARAGLPLLVPDHVSPEVAREVLALYPHSEMIAKVCVELCAAKGWRHAVLLHEKTAAGGALIAPDSEPLALLVRKLPASNEPVLLRNLLLVLKKQHLTNFIVWCRAECAVRVLDEAQRLGMLSARHSYLMLSLDLHTQPLANYSYGGANVTGLRLFDPNAETVRDMMQRWNASYARLFGSETAEAEVEKVMSSSPVSVQLAYQAIDIAVEALRLLQLPDAPAASCETGAAAFHADTLLNYLRSMEWGRGEGAGGEVSWEADGGRREVQLQVVELMRGGQLQEAGQWSPRTGLSWRRPPEPAASQPLYSMENRTFTVLVAKADPYVMPQESTLRLSGNDRYEGFCIELIQKLAEILRFNYTFVEHTDGGYGTYNQTTHKWNGMLGRLIDGPDIDFAVTDLTMTSEREKSVDFTTPFMNLGIAILFRKPKPPEPKLLAFLLPFSNGVWICLGLAYLVTSLVLYVVGRLCHEEWQNPYPCVEEPEALENQFTLSNALWFNLGAVLLQGSEIAPVAYGTRAVASAWWLFALVITSSYTANLATLLATKSTTEEIRSIQDLADNKVGIKYGAKAGGSTYTFFKNSQNELYRRMYEQMDEQEMPKRNEDGIHKVQTEDYAFLMESTSIDYVTERNCKVYKVGEALDSKGYGIAMKKGSEYRHALNLALLNLQEAGTLREMTYTWWKEKNGGGACKDDVGFESEELRMLNLRGLFLVLAVGSALGILISCCDLAWAAAKRQADPPVSYAARLWAELRFVFRFEQSVKPLQGPLIRSESRSMEQRCAVAEEGSPDDLDDQRQQEEEEACRAMRSCSRGVVGGSGVSGVGSRRRSSMHAASVRLARHAAPIPPYIPGALPEPPRR